MREIGWSNDYIREQFREYISTYKANKEKFSNLEEFINFCNKVDKLQEVGEKSKTSPIIKEYYQLKNGTFSIGDLKGLGIGPAQCTEFATCTQNLFAFLGYDTYLLVGMRYENGIGEPHNFNIINENGRWSLFDAPNNPIALYLKDDFDIDAFMSGDYKIETDGVQYTSLGINSLKNVDISSPHIKRNKK